MTGDVQEVLKVFISAPKQRPHRAWTLVDVPGLPLSSVVAQEGAVETRVGVLHQLNLESQKKTEQGSDLHLIWFNKALLI